MTRERPVSPAKAAAVVKEDKLITIGVDAHKGVHVAVAVDDAGREIDDWRGANSPEGWRSLRTWASLSGQE